MRQPEYFLPDWVVDGLRSGTVDRVVHGKGVARVYMDDGATWDISTVVTPEMREADRAAWRERVRASGGFISEHSMRFTVDVSQFKGFIYNAGG